MLARCVGAGALCITLMICAAIRADETAAQARARYDSGIAHYNLAEYQEALEDFKAAYRIRHEPALLFNIAQCYRQLGEVSQAGVFYRSFRRELPDAPNRKEVDRLVEEMDRAAENQHAGALKPVSPSPPPKIETPSVAPTTAGGLAIAKPPKPIVKRPWFWAVVSVGVAAAAAGIALGVVYGGPRDPAPSIGRIGGF